MQQTTAETTDLHHKEARVMKDPAEYHRSSSKEDIKKAQPEKLIGDTPEKPLPNTDVPCSLLSGKPTRKSTRKKLKNNLHSPGRTRRTSTITESSPEEQNSLEGIKGKPKQR
jgi:hypothetical protein